MAERNEDMRESGMVLSEDGSELVEMRDATGKVVVPGSVRVVLEGAFRGSGVTEVVLPDTCEDIRRQAFMDCANLVRVSAPGCVRVGESAFEECSALRDFETRGIERLEAFAFEGCASLKDVRLAAGLREIPRSAFAGCVSLQDPCLPGSITDIDDGAYAGCASITFLDLPAGLRRLGERAFSGCTSVRSVRIPDGLSQVASSSFAQCPCPAYEPDVFASGTQMPGTSLGLLNKNSDPHFIAEALLIQRSTAWKRRLDRILRARPQLADAIARELSSLVPLEYATPKGWARASAFVATHAFWICENTLRSFTKACQEGGCPCLRDFRRDRRVREKLGGVELGSDHALRLAIEGWEFIEELPLIRDLVTRPVRYADESGVCEMDAVVHIVAEALRKSRLPSSPDDFVCPSPSSAERVAELLDKADLCDALHSFVAAAASDEIDLLSPAWAAHAWNRDCSLELAVRNADALDGYRQGFLQRECERWSRSERHCDGHPLDAFRRARFASARECEKKAFESLGLDENGTRLLNLGDREISAHFEEDAAISLRSETCMRIKKLPATGPRVNATKRAEAAAWLSRSQDDINRLRGQCLRHMESALMEDIPFDSPSWKVVYQGHPVLRSVARLLVWEQNGATFTLGESGPCDWLGRAVAVGDDPIHLAHPVQMAPDTVRAWTEYYARAGLEQPIRQLDLPAVDPDSIPVNRYRHASSDIWDEIMQGLHRDGRRLGHTRWKEALVRGGSILFAPLAAWSTEVELLDIYLRDDARTASKLLFGLDYGVALSLLSRGDARIREFLDLLPLLELQGLADRARDLDDKSVLAVLLDRMWDRSGSSGKLSDLSL